MTHWGAYDLTVSDNQVVSVDPIESDPYPSPIGQSLAGTLNDDSRIKRPAVRKSYLEQGPTQAASKRARGRETFVEVSWQEAEALVANELQRVITEHGNSAIYGGSYGWASAGRLHHAQSQLHRFLDCIGGYTRSLDTYSLAAGEVILPHVLGDAWSYVVKPTSWTDIVSHTDLFVAFGGLPLKNSQIHAGGTTRHVQHGHMRDAQNAGVEFVNVSPIKDDTADFLHADWIDPRPNTDVAIMLGLAYSLLEEGLCNFEFLEKYCVGHEAFLDYVRGTSDGQPKDKHWAAAIAGINPEIIESLAGRMAQGRTMISVSWSLTRQDHGEQAYWMAVALAALLGQIGLPGGGVGFGYGAENKVGADTSAIQLGSFPGVPHKIDSFIPVARISDMLLNPGQTFNYNGGQYQYPDIKLVYWAGGNPFHHHQDLNRLHAAWQKPDTVIVHEIWWNSTARHADIVLPATSPLERDDIGGASGGTSIVAMQKAVEPPAGAKDDFEIFATLAQRLGKWEEFTEERDATQWLEDIYRQTKHNALERGVAMPEFAQFWEQGSFTFPAAIKPHTMLADFRELPDERPLQTPSGKIEIGSKTIDGFGYKDCRGYPCWFEPVEWLGSKQAELFPLHLISNQPAKRLHSQLDNGITSQESKINGREPIRINPDDAKQREIVTGDNVLVHNQRGAFIAGAIVSDELRRGVVQIATGAWWDPVFDNDGVSLCRHGNPNAVTLDKGTSNLAQGPSALSCLVQLERLAESAPDLQAFLAPVPAARI
jgi:biotin/methionine sulfoxide reductase